MFVSQTYYLGGGECPVNVGSVYEKQLQPEIGKLTVAITKLKSTHVSMFGIKLSNGKNRPPRTITDTTNTICSRKCVERGTVHFYVACAIDYRRSNVY